MQGSVYTKSEISKHSKYTIVVLISCHAKRTFHGEQGVPDGSHAVELLDDGVHVAGGAGVLEAGQPRRRPRAHAWHVLPLRQGNALVCRPMENGTKIRLVRPLVSDFLCSKLEGKTSFGISRSA